jgi:serine/threonine-protein kinase
LLTAVATTEPPEVFVRRHGTVVATFDHRTQDSGNVSWLVETLAGELFVKTAGTPGPAPAGAPVPYLDHAGRVALLRNAVALARSCPHPALARLRNVVESPLGPVLVYARAPGELVGTSRARRADPRSAYQRFAHLPAEPLLGAFDVLIDLHEALASAGWVASDLYDGCLLVEFGTGRLTVVDLDAYRRGPGPNTMGRMFGARRFMAPEEFELGAPTDQRTTVFTLGRLAWHFGTRLTERAAAFCGPPALVPVVRRACAPPREDRYAAVADFAAAWRRARTG